MIPPRLRNPASARRSLGLALVAGLIAGTVAPAAAPATNTPPPFAQGRLDKIDLFSKTLVVQTKQGPATFAWTDRTAIFFGKQRLPAEKLKPGDQVALRHYTGPDGTLFIQRLKVYRDGDGRPAEPQPLPPAIAPPKPPVP